MEAKKDEINSKISQILSLCNDVQIYSNIMEELFTVGIFKPSKKILSLKILPNLKEKELKNNFIKNIKKLIERIKSIIKSPQHDDTYKVLSCIYGAFLGDAMGAFCEFQQPNKNNSKNIFKLANTVIGGELGQVTDDSEMALSLAYAIMDNPMKDQLIPDFLYFYYGAWFKTKPLDYGKTTKNALKEFNFVKNNPNLNNFKDIEKTIFENNYDSLSNGFLMRKSPFIVWLYYRFYNDIDKAFNKTNNDVNDITDLINLYLKIRSLSEFDNKCTNPNKQVHVASGFYCLLALMAIKGLNSKMIIYNISKFCQCPYFQSLQKNDDEKFVSDLILYYLNMFKKKDFDLWNTFGDMQNKECVYHKMGYYLHAFKLILYFLYNFDNIKKNHPEKKYKEIMSQICDLGGDTDTNCCIVGAVIGPLIGVSNFGKELNKMIELIPTDRAIYSVAMILLFVIYLNKSNKDENLVKNDKYFLKQILIMLYGNIELEL